MSDAVAAAPGGQGMWRRSPAAKIGAILGLFGTLLVPQFLTSGLIHERENRQSAVRATFRDGWGPEQSVTGPTLLVPVSYKPPAYTERFTGWLRLPASHLDVTAALDPQLRRRGLFQATIYSAALELKGDVTIPPLPDLPGAPQVDWAGARVVIGTTDLRGTQPDQTMQWGATRATMEALGADSCRPALLDAPAGFTGPPSIGTTIPFAATMTLRGTQAFHVASTARQTVMHVTSSWPSPSFTGASLPVSYRTGTAGFDARWEVAGDPSQTGWRVVPACWSAAPTNPDNAPGVDLQEAVPTYAMIDRAAKYGVFYLALAFLTLFLFEALSGVRVHLVQYGLVGLSVSLFALLLVSIAEPLGFTVAYVISAAAIIAQASLYTLSVVRRTRLAAIFAGVLGALFAFIYVVLSLDTYALLAGTVALFAILSVLMAVTRHVNWGAAQAHL